MNCWNCGFRNEPDDEFCGNCGKYLKFAGETPDDSAAAGGAAAGAGATGAGAGATGAGGQAAPDAGASSGVSSGGPGVGSGAGMTSPDDPTAVYPRPDPGASGAGASAGTPGTGAWPPGAGPGGQVSRAPDIICWNCGRQNPASRTFCINCGQKLTAPDGAAGYGAAAAAAGGAGAGYSVTRRRAEANGGGGGGRTAAMILGGLALLFILGVVGALALGFFGSRPPGPVAVISPTPPGSIAASASPTSPVITPIASGSAVPSAGVTGPIITLPPPTLPPATRTPRPTCDATGAPRGCRPSPTPEPATPTPVPTPVNCSTASGVAKTVTLSATDNGEFPTRVVPPNRVWCIQGVTFTNASLSGATGTLKLFIENQEFIGPPGNYGMAKIGWPNCEANISFHFGGGSEYQPDPPCEYPFGYSYMPGNTIVSFEIVGCGTNGTCSGSATIEFLTVIAPPPPQP